MLKKNTKNLILKIIWLVIILIPAFCQAQQASYYFRHYQVQDGLSSNTITAILQDTKGFMWFGTRNGLNRFDGNTFKVFHHVASDSNSIGNNSILSLYEDKKGRLWVGTYHGIYIYDPRQESFSFFDKIVPGEVRYITGGKNQFIWIISNFTLYRYNTGNQRLTVFPFKNDQTVTLRCMDSGGIWIATASGLIKQLQVGSQQFTDYDLAALYKEERLTPIEDIYPVNDSLVLIGCMNRTLLLNTRAGTVKDIFRKNKTAGRDVHVHTIFRQSPNIFWMGTENGIYILDLRTLQAKIVSKEYNNPYSITDNIINAIYRDREGGIWVGTFFGGVNYFSTQYNNFRKYFPQPGEPSLSGNIVHEICRDDFGYLWVGTEDAGLNRINLKTGDIRHFIPDGKKGSICYHNIHGLIADGNELWIGTYEHGLDVMNIATGKVVRHYDASLNPHSLKSNFIVCIYRTRSGDILVGTWSGLFKYNRKEDYFDALPFFNSHIQSIHEDETGTIWVGTYGDGVYYKNRKTNIKGRLAHQEGEPNTLINNYVNNLFEDDQHTFWFCTESGLSHYTPSNGKIKNYTTNDGLPDNQVFRIMEDSNGNFWISTAKGLCRFRPENQSFTSFHTANGLPTDQFNYNSSFESDDGTFFFGTVKGMISFNPKDFFKNNFTPPVYITGLQLNNQDAVIGKGKGDLHQSIIYTDSLTLPYNKSNLSIEVAALSYIIPERNQYAYKMEGIDKAWVQLDRNRKIFYTKLPPGQYTFRLKGSNSDGVWNSHETRLNIEILPPIWATSWAYLLYILLASAIIILIIRYYHLAMTEKNKRKIETIQINTEREIYNAKINFFTNIAHEIRTPLTLIKMPLDKLINGCINEKEMDQTLQMMHKNTNRLIDLTNQLLDFRKAEADKLTLNFTDTNINELVSEVFTLFKSAAEKRELSYRLELPRIILHAYVDSEAVKKILVNLINNAIKYAGLQVQVKLLPFSSEDNNFYVEVRNDGYLIPDQYKEKIFEPFFRIKETEKEAGTGIGLPLVRSLVELHKGEIFLKTSPDSLNIFIVSLPIHQDVEINLHQVERTTPQPRIHAEMPLTANDTSKPTLLLVEDNLEILNYIGQELYAGYHVQKATNGQEALQLLKHKQIDIVVSDIMMPVMDGIALCRQMKTDLDYSHIPIILLTAKNSLQSKLEGLEVGADAYIEKPFSFDHLQAQISNLLSNRHIIRDYFTRSPLAHIKGIASSKADQEFLQRLHAAIDQHITDSKFDIEQLSATLNMSKATLYRKIKGLSDLTPNELINISRLKKAAELLSSGKYKVNEVAYMTGYSIPTNFSRDFKKQFGISPSAFLQQ